MNATGRVKRPNIISAPPTSSSVPARAAARIGRFQPMSSLIASLLLHGTTASLIAAANLQQMIFWNSIGIRSNGGVRVRALGRLGAVGIQLAIDAILFR